MLFESFIPSSPPLRVLFPASKRPSIAPLKVRTLTKAKIEPRELNRKEGNSRRSHLR